LNGNWNIMSPVPILQGTGMHWLKLKFGHPL